MHSKCVGCKYAEDLEEICPRYFNGMTEDGSPIIRQSEYPLLCKDCPERDVYFCKKYQDLICSNEQDPFDCKIDLARDNLYGTELIEKEIEALKRTLPEVR